MGVCYSYFYDVNHKKDAGMDWSNINSYLDKRKLNIVKGLQYNDSDTVNFSDPKVFLVEDNNGQKLKLRVAESIDGAKKQFSNVLFALKHKLPVSNLVSQYENFLLLEYIDGDKINSLSDNIVYDISRMHSDMNSIQLFDNVEFLESKLKSMLTSSKEILTTEFDLQSVFTKYNNLMFEFPKKLIPVFDHQDLGIHNIISNGSSIYLVDEEAFGLMPFGYSLHRALYGRNKYNICINDSHRELYLRNFSPDLTEYYYDTKDFWGNVLNFRSAARAVVANNINLAEKLLMENER